MVHLPNPLPSSGYQLNPQKNYKLELDRKRPTDAPIGLKISGGHNVVIIGGEIRVTGRIPNGYERAALLQGWTGTMHLEGIRFTSADGNLGEGIDIANSTGHAALELKNISIAKVHGSHATNHADCLQSWAGPAALRIDGFRCSSNYQGFFLTPNQRYDGPAPAAGAWRLRNVEINDATGAYALWRHNPKRVALTNVWVIARPARLGRRFWPSRSAWAKVKLGVPPRSVLSAKPGPGYAIHDGRG